MTHEDANQAILAPVVNTGITDTYLQGFHTGRGQQVFHVQEPGHFSFSHLCYGRHHNISVTNTSVVESTESGQNQFRSDKLACAKYASIVFSIIGLPCIEYNT